MQVLVYSDFIFYCFFCSGFCALTDVPEFTSDLKINLLAKCWGKALNDFTQVVKEICEEYDDKGTKKEEFIPEIDDGKSRSCINEILKDYAEKV